MSRIYSNISAKLHSKFLADTSVNFVCSGLSSAFNYASIILAGRFLAKTEFGTFNSLLALITLFSVLTTSMQLQITKQISQSNLATHRTYLEQVFARMILTAIAFIGFGLLFIPLISSALHTTQFELMTAFLCIVCLAFASLGNGLTFGTMKIKSQGLITVAAAMIRFFLTLALFLLGGGVLAGLSGYAFAFFLLFALSFYCTGQSLTLLSASINRAKITLFSYLKQITDCGTPRIELPDFLVTAGPMTSAFVLLNAPFSFDQVLIQYFNPQLSGDYGAVATLGKLIFYAASPIILAIFPQMTAAKDDPKRERRYFLFALGTTVAIACTMLAVLVLLREQVVHYTFSAQYMSVVPFLTPFWLSVVLYNCSFCLAYLAFARSDNSIVKYLLITLFFQILVFALRHSSLSELVYNQIAVYSVQLVLLVGGLLISSFRGEAEDLTVQAIAK